jgi:hypothetical protein
MSDELIEQLMYDYMVNVTVLSMKSDEAAKDGIKIIKNLLLKAQISTIQDFYPLGIGEEADRVTLVNLESKMEKRLSELREMLNNG